MWNHSIGMMLGFDLEYFRHLDRYGVARGVRVFSIQMCILQGAESVEKIATGRTAFAIADDAVEQRCRRTIDTSTICHRSPIRRTEFVDIGIG